MIHTTRCEARVNAQDPTYPTFKSMDCIAHCNANVNWNGRVMDCQAAIITLLITACRAWDQGIRLVVTIDDIDVSAALTGSLYIRHDKNMISTFSLNLGDTAYSPRTNANIDLDKVIVITAYINGQDKKLFTGLLDEPAADNTPAFRIIITGRDYGRKLLDKITTIISVQDLADSTKRNDLIKYLAAQAGQTDVNIPEMDAVTIDNSFNGQSIWDMIQKEAMVEQYWVRHNEDGKMELKLNEIKSDETLYPTPDWTYEEDRIIRVGYKKGRVEINKILVKGKTTQSIVPVSEVFDDENFIGSKFWAQAEATVWNETIGEYDILFTVTEDEPTYEKGTIRIDCNSAISFIAIRGTGGIAMRAGHHPGNPVITGYYWRWKVSAGGDLREAGVVITIGGANIEVDFEVRYDQISALVTDPNSIVKYGERNGGSVDYPLLETVEQCTAVGSKIIRDSHRLLGQATFLIPFNPLAEVGQTILVTDNKIGMDERYYIERLAHNIDINSGKIKARTQVGGVLYV